MQEALIRAIKFQDKFDGTNLRSWLYTILKRLCINKYHKDARDTENMKKLRHINTYAGVSTSTEDSIETDSVMKKIALEVSLLPDAYRAVAESIFIDGRSYQETADNLNLPMGTVMSKLFRARQILKSTLGELYTDK